MINKCTLYKKNNLKNNLKNNTINICRFLLLLLLLFGMGNAERVYGDGFIVVPHHGHIFPPRPPHPRPIPPRPPAPHPFPLEVKYHRVNVTIDDLAAVTEIDQVFVNPTPHRLEGYYIFPLPANAVIKKFSMWVDGKELEAELLDAKKARKIYEDIVRKQRDPALLEYMGKGLFKARIFPIEPRSEKRVKISYRQLLEKDNRTVEYLYPLNTEKFSAKPLKDVSVNVTLKANEKIKNIYCPTHEVDIVRKGDKKAIVSFEEKNTKPDIDFKLYYSTDNEKLGFSLLSYKKAKDEDGYFFLSLSPGYSSPGDVVSEKDITFVMDVSGSMAGKKMKQAKKALLFCIENLNKGDRFEIIRFSTEAEALFNGLSPVSETNRDKAREFIARLKAIGGTNIDEALAMAMKMDNKPAKKQNRPYMIIFLTDGKPTIGETDENALLKKIKDNNHSNCRVFTFGIGNDINTHLLDKITELTRAYRTYITEQEDIEIKVSNFYTNVQSPILTDLSIDFGSAVRVSKIHPRRLPDLFKGSTLTLLGHYKGSGDAAVVLSGKVGNTKKSFKFDVKNGFSGNGSPDSMKNDFIPALWAARRVGYLLDQIRLHGKDKELIDEITRLSRNFGIITPYTSYLIVEDERTNVHRRQLREEFQTMNQLAADAPEVDSESKRSFGDMVLKSGSGSVRASKEIQQMNAAENFSQAKPGQSRMAYKDKKGKTMNLAAQLRNIQGRAVYNTGKFWVDSQIQAHFPGSQKINRIKFAGDSYFKLLKEEPLAAQFLALGKNVRFLLNNIIYEIYE
jgi:Ca-activated chloride channel homolog